MADGQKAPVLIAGGGIGGLATALALARVGWPSLVLERQTEWSEAGAGIQLSPNGIRVLQSLGVADLLEPAAGRPREIIVRDAATAKILQRLPLGDWIARRHGAPYWQVHRRDLQAALVARVSADPRVSVVHGFEAEAFEAGDAGVHLRSLDGRSVTGPMLVAADGVSSGLREQLHKVGRPRFSGRTAARTVVTSSSENDAETVLRSDATGVWLAPDAHVVHYPVRGGREIAIVVVRAEQWDVRGWPGSEAEIVAHLRQVAPAFAEALGTGHEWRGWGLFELPPLPQWSKGRVTLLGDAAHPTMPFLAQGGVLALEDAATLAAKLAAVGSDAEIPAALAAYETARRDRSRRVVAAANRNGTIFHLSGPAAVARNLVMRMLPGERVMAGYDWVYGWRPPGEVV